ncbi:Type IV fimbrial biogenesis protein FimT [Metapseudomonas furukawaii]|uniref:Type II secretion system protein H n=2 Tax=Metapseudomonas furukawaii TaxID=1149133 RepID=A0AAD1FDF7_METFU|nr:Type IV fimbrial biogenesis protein FimT [Pseudomonas furukawaii]BAU72550.1 type IV fimbrial biogenesis protein FimT [Pseudomonas furukawaii]
MVVIAIVAIMASIGYPSFSTLIMNNRITSQTNALLGVLQLARSEAVTQRKAMTVCPSSNQSTCAAPNNNRWANGLVIRNADVGVVRVLSLSADTPVLGSGTASVVFATDGTSAGGTLRVCDSRGDADSRTILINAAGQSRSRAFQAGDLACP